MRGNLKQFKYYQAICDIVSIFGETEIGNGEVDTEAVAHYVNSNSFWNDTFECTKEEDLYELLTNDIIEGMPIWRFLKCSEWTKNMLEQEFQIRINEALEEAHKKYCCYSCEYFKQIETSLGTIYRCEYSEDKEDKIGRKIKRRDTLYELKQHCKNYKIKQEGKN